jgi:hypothetical protein
MTVVTGPERSTRTAVRPVDGRLVPPVPPRPPPDVPADSGRLEVAVAGAAGLAEAAPPGVEDAELPGAAEAEFGGTALSAGAAELPGVAESPGVAELAEAVPPDDAELAGCGEVSLAAAPSAGLACPELSSAAAGTLADLPGVAAGEQIR